MKKQAFTLIELLFVLIIMGLLASVAFYSFKINYIKDDVSFILMKLEKTKYQALNYDKSQNGGGVSTGCLSLDEDELKKSDNKTKSKPYVFRSEITKSQDVDILCFDIYGNLHKGEDDNNATTVDTLLSDDISLTLTYNNTQKATITILHKGGFMLIEYK